MPRDHAVQASAGRAANLLLPSARGSRFSRRIEVHRSGKAVLGRRRIYILPTGFGLLYGCAISVLFFGSLSAQNNAALLFTFLLVALGLVGMVHTWRNLLGLGVRIGDGRPVFAGQLAHFPMQIGDPGDRERPGLVLVAGRDPLVLNLIAGQPARVDLPVPTHSRGPHRLGQLRIETRYPLSLFRAWSYLDCSVTILVYPAPAATAPEAAREPSGRGSAGGGHAGSGMEDFLGLRPYQPGDPLTRIHWKAMARAGSPLVKEFAGEKGEAVWLTWDALAPGDMELRLSRLCRQVIEADRRGLRYGIRLPTLTLEPATGPNHRHRCLEALARFPAHGIG